MFHKIGSSYPLKIVKNSSLATEATVTPDIVHKSPSVTPTVTKIPQSVYSGDEESKLYECTQCPFSTRDEREAYKHTREPGEHTISGASKKKELELNSHLVLEPLDRENFLYFKARAISAGETTGANGNGDYFPLNELVKSYKTFIGRGLFLNHDSSRAESAVGKIIDAQMIVDSDSKEIWVECLCKIDKKAHPDLVRQVETGIIDSVSMGCSCLECECSACNKKMYSKDDFCEHMKTGLLKKMEKDGKEIQIYSINRELTFNELSLVSVPADSKAKIHEVIAMKKTEETNKENFKMDNLNKEAAELSPEAKGVFDNEFHKVWEHAKGLGKSDAEAKEMASAAGYEAVREKGLKAPAASASLNKGAYATSKDQPAVETKTTAQEQDHDKGPYEGSPALRKSEEEVKTTKDEQALKDVLHKLNAMEFINLREYVIAKDPLSKKAYGTEDSTKTKDLYPAKPGSEGSAEELDRYNHGKENEAGREYENVKGKENVEKTLKSQKDPELKEFADSILRRAPDLKSSQTPKIEKDAAGKDWGEDYGPEYREWEHADELKKIHEDILSRFKNKLATQLLRNSIKKEVNKVVKDSKKADFVYKRILANLSKLAQADPSGKEYYYWTGMKEPKHVVLPTTENEGIYRSQFDEAEDVMDVVPDTQTDVYIEQLDGDRKRAKDAWDKDTDFVKKVQEEVNDVMKGLRDMGFVVKPRTSGSNAGKNAVSSYTAEFVKNADLKTSKWIVKEAGEPVLEVELGKAWEEQLENPEVAKTATSEEYGKALIDRVKVDGLAKVADLTVGRILKAARPKVDEAKVHKLLESIETLLGIQESKEVEESEEKLPFEEKLVVELNQIETALKKMKPALKPSEPAGAPKPSKAPEKKEAPKPEEKKELPKLPLPKPHTGEGETSSQDGGARAPGRPEPSETTAAQTENLDKKAEVIKSSIFDTQKEVLIGDGIVARKDPETKMIAVVGSNGEKLGMYPDAFGDDPATVIAFFKSMFEKESQVKTEKEQRLEASLREEKTKAALREKMIHCRALVEEMLEKDLIQPDEEAVASAQKAGQSILDARKTGMQKAVDSQMSDLFKMDNIALQAFVRSIRSIKKEASKTLDNPPILRVPNPLERGLDDENFFKSLPWS